MVESGETLPPGYLEALLCKGSNFADVARPSKIATLRRWQIIKVSMNVALGTLPGQQ